MKWAYLQLEPWILRTFLRVNAVVTCELYRSKSLSNEVFEIIIAKYLKKLMIKVIADEFWISTLAKQYKWGISCKLKCPLNSSK